MEFQVQSVYLIYTSVKIIRSGLSFLLFSFIIFIFILIYFHIFYL